MLSMPIGLRSTRIRTFDRTFVSVPTGQIASVRVEMRSARDKYWFIRSSRSVRHEQETIFIANWLAWGRPPALAGD